MLRIIWTIIVFLRLFESQPLHAGNERFPLRLTDPWDFYPCALLEPESPLPENPRPFKTGNPWNLHETSCDNAKSQGYGSFRMRISGLSPRTEGYQIGLKVAYSSFRMFVYPESHPEERQEALSGRIGTSEDTILPAYQTRFLSFSPKAADESWIVLIQVANYQHARGGLVQPPLLGLGKTLSQEFQLEWESSILCIGFMGFMMIYSLMLYFRRTEDKASLCLSVTCLMFIARVIPTCNLLYYYVENPEAWLFRLHFNMEYASFVGGSTLYLLFTHFSFKSQSSPRLVKSLAWFGAAAFTFCLVAPVYELTSNLRILQLGSIAQMLAVVTILVRSIRLKKKGAWLACIGDLALTTCALYDVLMAAGIIPRTIYMTHYGACAFLFIQSQLVVQRFAQAFRSAERSQKELQEEVERQTEELRSMMHNIPQGVFVILDDLSIQGNYSRHLEQILQASDLTGRPALATLFTNSSLSQEQKDLASSALVASLGEDRVVWDMNAGNLPQTFLRRHPDGFLQILELDWNPIVNREESVHRVLVTVRDITQVKALEEETQRQKVEFDMILEMVQADRESIVRFFEQGRGLLNDTAEIQQGRQAFIKLHTLKGLARSYGLKRLTTQIHIVEQDLAQDQRDNWVAWNKIKFLTSIQPIQHLFDEYWRLLRDKLRWQDHAGHGPEFALDDLLELEQNARYQDPQKLQSSVKRILNKHLFRDLRDLIVGFQSDLQSLAEELGKPEPELRIDCQALRLSTSVDHLLRQGIMHLIRNAIDHGIESEETRKKAGKTVQGHVYITAAMHGDHFQLIVQDDGCGLHLESIRNLAKERGMLAKDARPHAQALAELIFLSGFSTRTTSTEVSGRGVGMDAVRESFTQAGGSVCIELLAEQPNAGGFVPFRIICQLPAAHFLETIATAS